MERNIQNPDQMKAREYQEIQNRATQEGHLEGIHTHESHDAREVLDPVRNAPQMGNSTIGSVGLGNGIEGTRSNETNQSVAEDKNPENLNLIDDCGCESADEETMKGLIDEVGD